MNESRVVGKRRARDMIGGRLSPKSTHDMWIEAEEDGINLVDTNCWSSSTSRSRRYHYFSCGPLLTAILMSIMSAANISLADSMKTQLLVETETVVLSGRHGSPTLRRRLGGTAANNIYRHEGGGPRRTSLDKRNIDDATIDGEIEKVEADLEDAEDLMDRIEAVQQDESGHELEDRNESVTGASSTAAQKDVFVNNTATTSNIGNNTTESDKNIVVKPTPRKKKARRRRRFCPVSKQRKKCRRCQSTVRRLFSSGKCSNDVKAARQGRDCNRRFDACRNAQYKFRCRQWRDAYANCFLPQTVALSNPNYDTSACEKACDLKFNADIRYNITGQELLTIGIAFWNDCLGPTTMEKINYYLCSKCVAEKSGSIMEDQCTEPESLMNLLLEVNGGMEGGSSVLPASAQRYLEFTRDPYENNSIEDLAGSMCRYQIMVDYAATASVQVFYEEFEADIEVDCEDDDDADTQSDTSLAAVAERQTIQPSPALDDAFASYFQKEEECIYADDDGCGARDVVFAGVNFIQEDRCTVVDDADGPTRPTFDIDPSTRNLQDEEVQEETQEAREPGEVMKYIPPSKRPGKKRRRVKLKGRNRKNGRCRRKCASRNKKVSDTVASPTNRQLQRLRLRCVDDEATRPNLKRELQYRQAEVGFSARKAAVVKVEEQECSIEAAACTDGSNGCCGTEGCSCSKEQITKGNCRAGTKRRDESIKACFLSFSGGLEEMNLCCQDAATVADECVEECRLY